LYIPKVSAGSCYRRICALTFEADMVN